jgi:signal transduction histidine kinase
VNSPAWLYWAAYGTWLICGLAPIVDIALGGFRGWPAASWLAAFLAFGVALILIMQPPRWFMAAGRAVHVSLLVLQSALGILMLALSGNGTSTATLVLVAAEAPHLLSVRFAAMLIAAQTVLMGVVSWWIAGWVNGLGVTVAIGGFQLFAVTSSLLSMRERDARESLALTNAELLATRALLAENTRMAERARIARDLHDTLGHHLTALSLQLDVASRLADGKAAQHVTEAHAIARLLLSDVRDVVSRTRDASIDVASAVRAFAGTRRRPAVHLTLPDTLLVDDPMRGEALVRCVQEVLTNASRHANAKNLWVTIASGTEGIVLHARDDGQGADALALGHGLRGMRERFEELAGHVDFSTAPGKGFEVRGVLPALQAS